MNSTTTNIALITGITGQDGSYLAELLLLEKEYIVYGMMRRSSTFNTSNINSIFDHSNLRLFYGDVTDLACLTNILAKIKTNHPQETTIIEIYNLAAQSHVQVSFEMPLYTGQVDAIGTLNMLEAIKVIGLSKRVRFYQASTSEMFGKVQEVPQSETTPFYPRSPYGVAKLYAYWIIKNYREAYGIYGCSGILFNHESERRGGTFVTRKITMSVARIANGQQTHPIALGNLNAKRDWSYAPDMVRAMWMMLQLDEPIDLVLASDEHHSVREFVELAFHEVGITVEWRGEDENEKGFCKDTGKLLVQVDPKYFRPAEVEELLGNSQLARRVLGWKPTVDFENLVKRMVKHDLKQNK